MTGTVQTIPPVRYEVAFNADPNQAVVQPWFTDVSARVVYPWTAEHGRLYEIDANETGVWRPTFANGDGALDPANAASPYAPGVIPYRQARIRCLPGPNLLWPDQATAGEGSGYGPGPVPPQTQVTCAAGYPLSYAASGSAFQGAQVYQVAVPNGAAQPRDLLDVSFVAAQPNTAYSATVQARVLATVQALTESAAIDWYNSSGTVISTTSGTGVAITGGSASWTQLTASGTSPAGTVYCQVRAVLGTTSTASASAQFDGLQFEANPFPTLFQVPNTLSANLFPRNIATGGLASGPVSGSWSSAAGSLAYATGVAAAPTGHTTAAAWTSPPGTTSASPLLFGGTPAGPCADVVQVTAGTTYTFSAYGLRAASADATLAVVPAIGWYSLAGVLVAASSVAAATLGTGAWARPSVTGTAPAGAAWGRPQWAVTTPGTTTATNVVYATGAQFEAAGSASAWQDPGPVLPILTPYVEQWPETWTELDGTFGTTDAQSPDAFVGLSQFTLPAPYVAELMALNPNFLFELAEPTGSTACADTAGKRTAAPVENSPYGSGSLTLGNPVAAAQLPSGGFIGTPGPVATFNNNTGSGFQLPETYVSLHKTTNAPGPPVNTSWTRLLAFRVSATPGALNAYQMWCAAPRRVTENSFFEFAIIGSGSAFISFTDAPGTGGATWTSPGSVCDGNWHLAAIGVDLPSGNSSAWFDGANVATAASTVAASDLFNDVIGCLVQSDISQYSAGFKGDAAFAAELPLLLSNTQALNLYNSFRTASTGDSTGARANRILNWINWTGPRAIDTGSTSSMGPATDTTGASALDALNNVALTENGNFYAAANGALTLKGRSSRYGQLVPKFTFGESKTAGEWPYESCLDGFDPKHIGSDVQVTQYGGPQVTAFSAASRASYFPRVYQRTVNTTGLPECQDAANYLLAANRDAHLRVGTLVLHPSAVPGLFAVCLALELGTRVRVMRRPPGAPAITFDGFVEKISWQWNPEASDVFVTLECSPASLATYWVVGALHTTLHAQATAGAGTITVNALPDAAVNVLRASLPSGYQLTLDPGNPALAETVTIAPGGIPTTTLGYASATLAITGTLAHTHASGAVVCEPLPAGATDPTVWDASSVLGATATTFALAATAGASTITISALPDAKYNALASSIPQGWQAQLSPGTANAETVTVAPGGIPTTYPGWSTAVLTITGTLAHSHAAGDTVCDVLPAGVASPSAVNATTILAY
jgi:hypothetical protein